MKLKKPSLKKLSPKKLFGKLKQIFKNKKSRRIFIVAVAVLVVLGIFLGKYIAAKNAAKKSGSVTATVDRGDISNVIEGTGTVEAISQYEITSLAKGDVIADYFEEGDYVEKDQLLYEIDSESVNKSIEKQQSSITKSQLSYSDAAESASNLNVKSTIGGVITNLYVAVGDNVQSGSKVADVIDKDNLKLSVPFGEDDARHIYAGQSATVTLANSLTTIYGTVSSVGTGTYTNSYGVNVVEVEISLKNPGTLTSGELATAKIGSYACYDSGELEYGSSYTVTAKTSGEVTKINKKKGDAVSNGTIIVTLKNSSTSKSVKEAQLSLNDAQLSLDTLYDDLDDYRITAPIAGKVIQKNVKAGEKLDTNSTSVMAIIADLSTLTFDISIDELDISSISVGQEVDITADAIKNQTFKGTVSKISIVGESNQGVTSYPVTVTIDNSEESELIPGMNVSASIKVESVEDVLRVPVSAVRMGNFVIVKDDGSFTSAKSSTKENDSKTTDDSEKEQKRTENMLDKLEIPSGYTAVSVETGLTDGSYIEVKEKDGSLKEGDTILLPDVTANSSKDSENQDNMPGGGMAGGGGMPGGGGGMPGGGGAPGGGGGNRGGGGGMPGGR